MGIKRKDLGRLGLGLSLAGTLAEGVDSDRVGLDDKLGISLRIGGGALTRLSAGGGQGRDDAAASAIDEVINVLSEVRDELRAGRVA
jgi:hypothetical protein